MLETPRRILAILDRKEVRSAFMLLILMIIGMALETLGIGLVIPILLAITDIEAARSFPIIADILVSFNDMSQLYLIGFCMIALVCVYAIKVGFLAFLAWRQADFIFGLSVSLSSRLFHGYLRQPYAFHLRKSSAELIRNITVEVSQLTTALTAVCLLVAECLVVVGISALLFVSEPLGACLVMVSLGVSAAGFYLFTRHQVLRWGVGRQGHEELRLKWLHQGLGGVKEIKISGTEDEFTREYNYHTSQMSMNAQKMFVIQAMPRLWLELMAVTGLAVLVVSMLLQEKSVQTILPVLGLFAAAAFRIMPSINRFLGGVQTLRYNIPVVDVLYRECKIIKELPENQVSQRMEFSEALSVRDLSFTHEGKSQKTLDHLNLSIKKGSIVGFIGESGSGKSTLIDVFLGVLVPQDGGVYVDGHNICNHIRSWQDQIGYVSQSIYLVDASLRRNVAFGVPEDQIDDTEVIRALKAAQLLDFASEQPEGIETVVGERGVRLSGGQRQRIGIARALYRDPDVLILDEATSALDTNTENEVMKLVFALRGEKTILIVAHRLSTVENCDWLYKLERGQIVASGKSKDVLSNQVTTAIGAQ